MQSLQHYKKDPLIHIFRDLCDIFCKNGDYSGFYTSLNDKNVLMGTLFDFSNNVKVQKNHILKKTITSLLFPPPLARFGQLLFFLMNFLLL